MSGSYEMVRVRVLFLEPGDLIHPSELDDGITEYCIKEKKQIYGEDYADFNVYKINSAALADSIQISSELHCQIVSTPNDPCVEMLVPMTVVYFDLLGVDSDWTGRGGLGYDVENIGLFETFHGDYETLVNHAKSIRPKRRKCQPDEMWGQKVDFLVVYHWHSWTDYWGEWDCEHTLEGYFRVGDIPLRKFGSEKDASVCPAHGLEPGGDLLCSPPALPVAVAKKEVSST